MNSSARQDDGSRVPSGPGSRVPGPVFALAAGEDSGDQLGADLIEALRARYPDARFVGVGGPRMRAVGFDAWHDISELSVMGIAEVLRHLPRLLRLRASLAKRLIALAPDAFIGIDAPDFNLGLEKKLKRAGVRTVHYVSPSVWAWREHRAAKIGESADLVLCLFPMEPPIYAKHGVSAQFVGHPLADRFPLDPDQAAARAELGLPVDAPVLAVLPGSRLSEIHRLGAIFLDAAQRVATEISGLQIVIPAANERRRHEIESLLWKSGIGTRGPGSANASNSPVVEEPGITDAHSVTSQASGSVALPGPGPRVPSPVVLLDGHAHEAMAAADVVLVASGTATLETMLAKRPMVVAYRIAPLTYATVKGLGMLKTDTYSLPNVLAGRRLVPELMQSECTPDKLAAALVELFRSPAQRDQLVREFERMHLALHAGGGGAATAARAVDQLITQPDRVGQRS
ncbi:MAG TPA: lipid-A-disaccharide synthase [Rhodanobacteraceae bacterium]|nr:lipid-A-disaccharide synthase [Rhodanobacteraceae bacterium]